MSQLVTSDLTLLFNQDDKNEWPGYRKDDFVLDGLMLGDTITQQNLIDL